MEDKQKKIMAFYIGDLRFVEEKIGKFFFDYDATTKTFIMRGNTVGNNTPVYDLKTVMEDEDFILLEYVDAKTGDKLCDELNQIDKMGFFLEELEK